MLPQWFRETDVPYTEMWPDDKEWYPLMFSDKNFNASFVFEGYDKILSQSINVTCNISNAFVGWQRK